MKTQIFLATASILLSGIFAMAQENGEAKTEVRKLQSIEVKSNDEANTDTALYANNAPWEFYGPRGRFERGRQYSAPDNAPRGAGFGMMNNNIEWETKVNNEGDSVKVFKFEAPCGIVREIETDMNFEPGQGRMYSGRRNSRQAQGRMTMKHNKNFHNMPQHQSMNRGMGMHNGPLNLNDEKIISFEKETLKDGSEKITIIRKKAE
ncbi:MAG: hypothetical protein JW735_06790 [Prolixibacteraceae bacterium]|nr:hypothetical protein [Prolixibacteraceae bacterium]